MREPGGTLSPPRSSLTSPPIQRDLQLLQRPINLADALDTCEIFADGHAGIHASHVKELSVSACRNGTRGFIQSLTINLSTRYIMQPAPGRAPFYRSGRRRYLSVAPTPYSSPPIQRDSTIGFNLKLLSSLPPPLSARSNLGIDPPCRT